MRTGMGLMGKRNQMKSTPMVIVIRRNFGSTIVGSGGGGIPTRKEVPGKVLI